MDFKKIEGIRLRHKSRMDDGWITINGTHVMVDKDGNLQGEVGKKISGTSKRKSQSSGSSNKPSASGSSSTSSSKGNDGSGIKSHGKWKATNFNDALKEMKEELPGRGRYDLETYVGNSNPNKMAMEDNYTIKSHVITLGPKAARDKELTGRLKEMGFVNKGGDNRSWRKEISDSRKKSTSSSESNKKGDNPTKNAAYYKKKYGDKWMKALYNGWD